MSLRDRIGRMIAAWTYSGPPWLDRDWEIATDRANQILAAIEAERRSQTLDDLQQAGQVCDSEAAIRAAERERLAKVAEERAASPGTPLMITPHITWRQVANFIRSQGETK